MLLNVSSLKNRPGGTLPFEVSLDLHTFAFGGCCPVTEPVRTVGEVRNTADVMIVSGKVTTTLHGKADENSGVQWFPIDAVNEIAGEAVMEMVYTKLNEKLKALG